MILQTPLTESAEELGIHTERARLLINDRRIDLSLQDHGGMTAFDIACDKGLNELAGLIHSKMIMNELRKHVK